MNSMDCFYFLDELQLNDDQGEIYTYYPRVADANMNSESFNTMLVALDAGLASPLDWSEAKKVALENINKGKKILWDIRLGLFAGLPMPLENQAQFQSLALSLEHFKETIWQEFKAASLGACLYKGPAHLPVEHASEYIQLLARHLPGELPPFVFLENDNLNDSLSLGHWISKERYESICRALKTKNIYSYTSVVHGFYGEENRENPRLASIAICLPELKNFIFETVLRQAIKTLEKEKIPFRIIPEATLTAEWNLLDFIICESNATTANGLRKLKGFCAAGGTVVTMGKPLGLPNELTWNPKIFKQTL